MECRSAMGRVDTNRCWQWYVLMLAPHPHTPPITVDNKKSRKKIKKNRARPPSSYFTSALVLPQATFCASASRTSSSLLGSGPLLPSLRTTSSPHLRSITQKNEYTHVSSLTGRHPIYARLTNTKKNKNYSVALSPLSLAHCRNLEALRLMPACRSATFCSPSEGNQQPT